MKYLSGSIVARIAGAALLAAGLTSAAQTTTTQIATVRSRAAGSGQTASVSKSVQIAPNGTRYNKVTAPQAAAATHTQTAKITVKTAAASAKVSKAPVAKPALRPRPQFAPAPTVVSSSNFGNATIGGTPVTMTLNYPADATSPGASSVVASGGVAPGSASDYIFFGNSNVEFGQGGGGQPSNLTNFTVSTLNNVEYPGNGNYTMITAPGGNSAFTTGTVTENPTNYPNTTPHTKLLATFSPLNAGSFTVYILDGNTDGVVVGNSSVGLGVNGGSAVVTATHYLSGTNEFTRYNVANASPSDVFQVYATTSTNSYPTIGGLTFVMGTSSGTSGGGLTAATTANQDFQVSSTNCTGSTCSVQVTFTPGFPGLRYDALTLTDSDGNMVYQTYLYGLGMGPQFGYEIGNYTEYDGYLTTPLGVAFGPDDFLYFTQTGSNVITKFPRDFSDSSQITLNGLATPSGIAVDGSNTLYVADQTNNVIISYSAAGVQGTVTTSPLNGPSQLAVDGTGALYIADTGNGRIIKIDNQGNETTVASGLTSPTSVTVDSNGNVFFADSANNGEILELAAGASSVTTYTSQMNLTVVNMATDASETIYVTTNQGIAFYRNGGQDGIFYATGADIPVGLAVERNGDVFQTNPLKDKFSMNDRSSSNFILNTPPNTTANGSYPIYNTGNTPLTLSGLSITGPEFQIANSPPQCTPPQVIAPAKSCTVNISFLPPLARYYTDTAIATSNSLNMPGTTDPFYLAGSGTGAQSITTLSAAPSQVQSGSPVELLVTVSDSPMTFTPSGTVTFMEGSLVLGTATLVPGVLADTATATLTISSISLGMHIYTAAFPGDANVSPSTSSNLTVFGYPAGSQPNGPITTVNFGNQTLGGAATTSVTLPNNTAQITSTNPEFSSSSLSCSSSCTANVGFFPEFPGLRTSAYLAYDSEGTFLGKVYAYGVGLAPLFGFDPANLTLYSGTVGAPGAEAFGPDRSLYLADNSTNEIFIAVNGVFQNSSNPSPIVQLPIVNLGTIGGIAVDGGNKIYISDQTNNLIVTYDQAMPSQASAQGAIPTSPLSNPTGVAVDAAGNLYIADTGHARILEIDNQGNETTAVSGVEQVGPLAVDSMGGLYYAISANAGSIMYLTPGGGAPTLYANGISNIHGLAVDASNRVYYTNDAGLSILPLPSCSGCFIEGVATQFPAQALDGVVLDGGGDLFTTQPSTGFFGLLVRAGGNSAVTGPVGMSTAGAPFTVSNLGNMPLTLSSIAFQDSSAFNAGSGSTCSNGTVLQAGSNCDIVPNFTPAQPQPYTDPVTFTSNNGGSPGGTNTFTLNGTGVPAGGGSGTTTLGLSPTGSISLGQPLTLTATVTGVTSSAPTGTVNFLSGGIAIASGTLVQNGSSATASVVVTDSSLAVGTFTITAMYTGDAFNPSSTSAQQTINVTQGTPSITVTGQTPIAVGQSEQLTATISSLASTAPTGSVRFLDGDNTLGVMDVGQTSTGGTATLTVSTLSVGTHIITAQYSGDSNYNSVNSSPFTVTVTGVVNSTNFGSVAVGSSSDPMTLTFPSGANSNFVSVNTAEFNISNTSCDPACNVTVTFTPQSPGLRYGAITLQDNFGNLIQKTYVYGTGQAPQFAFDPPYNQSTVTPYSAGSPVDIAVGPDGTVYVSDSNTNTVTGYPVSGDSFTVPLGDIGQVGSIAVDGSNTVYVSDDENFQIVSSTASGVVSTIPSGNASNLGRNVTLAVDGTGALYILAANSEAIFKIDNQGNETTLVSTGNAAGMTVDAAGDVFYTDSDGTQGFIYELPANGGSTITVASGLPSTIYTLAIDAAGRLYYLTYGDPSTLNGLSPGTTAPGSSFQVTIPRSSGGFTGGLAITPTGGILATEAVNGSADVVALFDRMEASANTSAQVGSTSTLMFPISNTGNKPLTIAGLSFEGSGFTIDPESACHSGSTVAPDRECIVTVDFMPAAAVNYQVLLTAFTNSLNSDEAHNAITLYGVGGDSSSINLGVSSNSITLGQSVTLTATVTDNVSSATPTGTVTFQVGGPVGTVTLTAGSTPGTAIASYTYTPTAEGAYAVGATYSGDSTIAPLTAAGQTLQVNEPAGPPAVVTSQNFGSVAVGQSATMTLNFNQGMNSRISLASNLEFTVVGQTCNLTCSVTIMFKPLVPGLRQDAILVKDESGNLQAKEYVYGTGTGPQFGFLPGQSSIDTAYASPTAITFTPDGIGYVTDAATQKVYPLYTGAQPFPITGLGIPSGIAVDGARTFYIADQTNNLIVTFNQLNNVQGVLSTSPLSSPSGVATDGTGAVYIADKGNNRIIKIDNQGTETTLASGLSSPLAIALDAGGNVYFSDSSNGNEVAEIPAAGGAPVRLFAALGTTGIAVDASGSVYTVGSSFSGIHDFISQNSAIGFSGSTGGSLTGIGINFNGDIWTMKSSTGQLEQLHRGSTSFNSSTPAGVSKQHTVQVVNTGNAPLTISNLAFGTGTIFTFGAGSPCATGTVLNAGSECDTYVVFLPPSAQNYSDVLTYTTNTLNAPGSTNTDNENGTGTGSGAPATSTTTFVATPTSVMVGQTIGVVATVSDGTGITPTGTVQFLNGTTVVASATLSAGSTSGTATASATIPSMAAGTYSIVAMYVGSSNVAASTSAAQNLIFTPATTTTVVIASALNITVGQNETLTATISGFASPAMSGTVNFFDGTTSIGSGTVTATSTGGVATLRLGTTVPVGTHSFTATYNADANYLASTSQPITVTVSPASAAPTRVSLIVGGGNNPAYERPVSLNATVTASSSGAPVTVGQVIFCETGQLYPRCNLLSNLGVAQLNSGGVATLRINPGQIGVHDYVAEFLGTNAFQAAGSSSQEVIVSGIYPSVTSLVSSGSPGDYSLTATVTGLGSIGFLTQGTVSFIDTTNGNSSLGSKSLSFFTPGFNEAQPTGSPLSVGPEPYGVAAGDLNGDGFVDIVTGNYGGSSVSVAFGLGDGTFLAPATYAVGSDPERVLIADFNGDGYSDIVVANTGSNTVSVLLNNGDGTFKPQVTYPVSSPVGLGVMDVNHDGIADIVASDYYSNTVSVLIGNGDGTFKTAVTYRAGNTPQTMAEGDFNGDGNIDLVVGNLGDNNVGIYLGNGDGTFQTPAVTYAVGSQPQGVQVGDFNGDGIADLAVSNNRDGTVSVLIGKGDGTFLPQVTYAVGGGPVGLVIADFNGDGHQDIAVGDTAQASLTESILLGNGDGTFQPQVTFKTGNFPYGEAVGDFNGDGFPDLVISTFSDSTATILLSQITESSTATITGVAVTGAGTHAVDAVYGGNANYSTSTSNSVPLTPAGSPTETITSVSFTGSPANPTITISGSGFNPEPIGDNEPTSFYGQTGQDFGVNGLYIMDGFGAGQDGDAIGLINLSYTDSLISFQFGSDYPSQFANALAEGDSYTVSVNGVTFSGTVHYPALTSQTITFSSIPNHTFGDAPFTISATASSGLPISFAVTSGPATISGSTVTLTGAGSVTIQATQAGNSTYAAATPVSQSFTVAQASQTITFPSIPNHTFGDAPFSISATSSSGLAVSFAVTSGPATISGSTVTLTGAGTVTIQATQNGNTNYAAATPVSQSFTVAQASQTITFPSIPNQVTTAAPFSLSATASSGLAVSYTVTSGPATVSGSTVTLTGTAGTVVIQATQAGNTNYAAATPVSQSFTVSVATGAATTITLTTNGGTGVAYGTPVKLTASVANASGGPVTVGQVIFCSATAAHCNLNSNLGIAQLNANGTAVLSVGSGAVGSHSYIAEFLETTAYQAATSSAKTVTVTDATVYSTTTTIASTGSAGNYTLTGTVASIGSTTLTPTGSVSFVDTTNGNAALGSASLGAATAVYSQIQSAQPVVSNGPAGVATGDFNGDGFIDMVTADAEAREITVLLGHGDGTFRADANYVVGNTPEAVMVADFNGDGILDIVVANASDSTVGVMVGNGDGTFKPQVTYAVGSSPDALGVMDLNHDGVPDIVAVNNLSNSVSVLIGNGDGTFKTAVSYTTGSSPESLAEGDFNGDGNVDLAITNISAGTVSILLGNGDGTFQTQVTYPAGTTAQANFVQAGDFNGDGKADLAVSNNGGGTVSILLGIGDGSFKAPVAYAAGNGPGGLTIADFNGDGKQDIAVANGTDNTVSFLLGNGDGTFQLATQLTFSTVAPLGAGVASADFNGDGLPDLTVSSFSSNGYETVRLSQLTQTATATITGVALGGNAGPHNVDAVYAGNSSFKTSTSSPISLTSLGSGPAAQTITFPSIPNHTFGDAPFTLNATASSGLPVSYAVTSGPATVLGNTVTLTGAGSITIQATQAGSTNYSAATPVSQSFTVAQASQTITFPTIPNHTTTDAPFSLNATASSGLAVSYTVTSGPATIAGSTVTLTGAGTVVIQAAQAGNTNYLAATPVSRSFTVSLASQTITFPAIPSHTFGDAPFTLNATASSGLGVSYTVTSGPAMVSGNTVTLTGAGTVTIQTNQAGNTIYAAATSVSQSFTVAAESQTITFPAIPNHAATDPPFTLNATALSGLTVSYAVTSGPATLSGNTVTLTGTGTVVILASQAGNTNFAAATSVSQSFAVAAASQTITFPAIPNHTFGDAPFTLNATASSNLPVTYTVTSGSATITGSTVTLTSVGTVVIQATQAGNATYAAATPVSQSFVVLPGAPTLVSITPPSGVVNSGATTITLTGSNFAATDIVQLNGTTLASTYVNATTLTAIIPASFFTAARTGQVTVADSSGRTTTGQTFTVVTAPAINFSGPATTTSAAQPALTFQLVNPYPLPISGTLNLTFTPAGANGVDDPAVQFSSGGRTMSFSIPALSTLTPTVQIQTGTVAGTATITLLVTSNGVNVTPANVTPVQITIAAAAPTITTSAITRAGNSLSVSVEGFSNTRELATAIFHFTAVPGSTISTPDITAPVGTVFGNYFTSAASTGFGSTFLYIQTFNLNNDASSIQSVTVTLVNTQGDSMVSTSQ